MKLPPTLPDGFTQSVSFIQSLFISHCKIMPSTKHFSDIDYPSFIAAITSTYKFHHSDILYDDSPSYFGGYDKDIATYRLQKNIIFSITYNSNYRRYCVNIYYDPAIVNSKPYKQIVSICESCPKKEQVDKNSIHLLSCSESVFRLEKMSLNSSLKFNISLNYNDSFLPIDSLFREKLSRVNGTGIFLLYGTYGTGKSNYIRYLANTIKKKLIYIPQEIIPSIGLPSFIPFLVSCANSIFIIEDAELVLKTRKAGGSPAVANLLNISDGLLGDCLNIQIICTFNTELEQIDKAFLRKGRLEGLYEFTALSKEKAQALSDSLGFTRKIDQPMTLADIYNYEQPDFNSKRQLVGFKR